MNYLMSQIWFHHFITWWLICGIVYAITAIIALNTTDIELRDKKSGIFLAFAIMVCVASGMLGLGYVIYCVIANAVKSRKR